MGRFTLQVCKIWQIACIINHDYYNIIYSTLVFLAVLSNSVLTPLRITSNVYYVKNMGANIFLLYVFNAGLLFS